MVYPEERARCYRARAEECLRLSELGATPDAQAQYRHIAVLGIQHQARTKFIRCSKARCSGVPRLSRLMQARRHAPDAADRAIPALFLAPRPSRRCCAPVPAGLVTIAEARWQAG